VDDLWHAAVNGHGLFVNARDPQELQAGMVRILKEADNLQASRTGAAFSSVAFSATDNFIYRVTIEPGWGGTLTKVEVDPLGEAGEIKEVMLYHKALADQVTPASAGDKPWYDKRKVVTWNPDSSVNKAVPFKLDQLSASQQSSLGSTSTVQQKVVDYLRGDKANEGTSLSRFRVRTQILGDIVNSSRSSSASRRASTRTRPTPATRTSRKPPSCARRWSTSGRTTACSTPSTRTRAPSCSRTSRASPTAPWPTRASRCSRRRTRSSSTRCSSTRRRSRRT
jgi:type IV pilus assembly protein PilY1